MFYEFSLNNAFKIIWDVQFWHIFALNMSHVFPNLTCILLEIIEVDLGYLLYKCFFKHFLTHTVFRYFLGCLYAVSPGQSGGLTKIWNLSTKRVLHLISSSACCWIQDSGRQLIPVVCSWPVCSSMHVSFQVSRHQCHSARRSFTVITLLQIGMKALREARWGVHAIHCSFCSRCMKDPLEYLVTVKVLGEPESKGTHRQESSDSWLRLPGLHCSEPRAY